jgi:DNA-binding CsgD family transcriptional regulator
MTEKPTGQRPKRLASPPPGSSWEQRFEELESFQKQFGHCNVSARYKPNPTLAAWVAKQRRMKRCGRLAADKVHLLDALGVGWEQGTAAVVLAAIWKRRFNELKAFKKEHGHCNVPAGYPPNRPLASWVSFNRSQKKAGRLAKERIRRLEELGFCWVLKHRSVHRLDWDMMLAALAAFKERHGHCNVPGGWPEDPRLYWWVNRLRRKKREGKLDRRQIAQLNRLGIVWEPSPKPRWPEMYAALVEYKKVHGDCNVPHGWSKNPYLCAWVVRQRYARKASRLEQSRIEQLDKIGFVWNCVEFNWESNYSALAKFREEFGHCRVSTLSKTHARLAFWVRMLRAKKKQGKLTAEQIRRLDLLGFTWDMSNPSFASEKVPLTQREADVLRRMAGGLTNQQIADMLHIGNAAVVDHLQHIFRKLNVISRTQAVAWAARNDLV